MKQKHYKNRANLRGDARWHFLPGRSFANCIGFFVGGGLCLVAESRPSPDGASADAARSVATHRVGLCDATGLRTARVPYKKDKTESEQSAINSINGLAGAVSLPGTSSVGMFGVFADAGRVVGCGGVGPPDAALIREVFSFIIAESAVF